MRDLTLDTAPVATAPSRKFGTFLGVFTPSILTILGVIMYQRLGWVVGQAGAMGALAVVLLAHVISVTTGLSVASIATNHTVRTGGNYYIISRSLGLSVGGAIGIALYIALALSVSLYLIGFAEAFIAGTGIVPLGDAEDSIRVIGTVSLFALAALTLWSTSIALKSQLFVLAAIVLSLAAVVFGPSIEAPAVVGGAAESSVRGEQADFAVVFAVFFPAVTGFTAGVGMSGDLRDPKRAIPLGTILAIITGLVIYVGLIFLLDARAPREVLREDYNVLRRLAFEPNLVTAGVFAATLSSAVGSMLGAPRTLQALAFDGILPEWLGRGDKEPRIALAVTLLIAEAGILVAELAVVGAVISMFFLTCYGFLCLACGLERWASPDFRPQFKVPIAVSLIGALAAFLVMFQIDPLAMLAAIVVMSGLYLFLKRRQLVLGSGDTWGGVWSAVVRVGLMRLQQSASREAQRNWRPNMLVAGRNRGKSPLLDFGRALVGDRGILTHVHLVEGKESPPRVDRSLEADYPGIFGRIQGVRDTYDAIPTLAANFGLVGMETNTVLLGWPREASQRKAYSEMVERLLALDLSVLMLRFDEARGFGRKERIDIWWDGEAPTGPLMLTLAHLLLSSAEWKRARVRVLVNGRTGRDVVRTERALEAIIQDARVRAEGVVLPPVGSRPALAERIRQESSRADLVLLHAVSPETGEGFVPANDELMSSLGTTLLVRPSRFFAQRARVFEPGTTDLHGATERRISVPSPAPVLLEPLRSFEQRLSEATERFAKMFDEPSWAEEAALLDAVERTVAEIRKLEPRLPKRGDRPASARALVEWARSRFTSSLGARFEQPFSVEGKRREEGGGWERRLRSALERVGADVDDAIRSLPETVDIPTDLVEWHAAPGDGPWTRVRKLAVRARMRLFSSGPPARRVWVRRPASERFRSSLGPLLEDVVRAAGVRRETGLAQARRLVTETLRFFDRLMAELDREAGEDFDVRAFRDVVTRQLEGLESRVDEERERLSALKRGPLERLSGGFSMSAGALSESWATAKHEKPPPPARSAAGEALGAWNEHHRALVDLARLDLQLEACAADARRSTAAVAVRVRREIQQGPLASIDRAVGAMRRVSTLAEQWEASEADREFDSDDRAAESAQGGATEPSGDGGRIGPDSAERERGITEQMASAADALRQTFDRPYRPPVQELMDGLLASLGRGAERIFGSVVVPTETAVEQALAGQLTRAFVSVSAQRNSQTFLERRVVDPTRTLLDRLPKAVRTAEDVLVDAVRLVAFELEQLGATTQPDRGDQVEEAGTLALGGTLEERIRRLGAARSELEQFLSELDRTLLLEVPSSLEEIRASVYGATSGSASKPVRSSGVPALRRWVARAESARVRAREATSRLRPRRPQRGPPPAGNVVDEIMRLREELAPDPDVQAQLPLLYRRMFGRAALETRDLVRGRDAELAALDGLYRRWEAGSPGAVAVVGSPRSGRSTLATVWARGLGSPVLRVAVASGDASVTDLNAAVAAAAGAREGRSAEGALRAIAPGAIVVVDELGPWLERSPEGPSALRAWTRLFRRLGDRHLFILTATPWAFRFADLAVDASHAFIGVVPSSPLTSDELSEALLLRQRTSDFELELGSSKGVAGRRGATRKQLDRLWSRARGNIGDAVDLWRRSVVEVTERRIRIDVRAEPDLTPLERLPDTWRVALASVALHRAVTTGKLARVLRTSREDAASLLQDLARASLVQERAGSWELDPLLQAPIIRVLQKGGLLT